MNCYIGWIIFSFDFLGKFFDSIGFRDLFYKIGYLTARRTGGKIVHPFAPILHFPVYAFATTLYSEN
jgi:hypothetical protein